MPFCSPRTSFCFQFIAAGEDYVARSNVRIRWQPGEVNHIPTDPPFEFEILDDEVAEARVKFFEIELTITRNALLYSVAVGRVTIIDDDGFSMFKILSDACCL